MTSFTKVEKLKVEGRFEEAGRLASELNGPRFFGAHYGMKSDREASIEAFFKGYDEHVREAANDEASAMEIVGRIVDRYNDIAEPGRRFTGSERWACMIDILNTHLNCCTLKLDQMLSWPRDFDVVHDVVGIWNHYNRETGKLDGGFLPRFAMMEQFKEAHDETSV